MANVPMEFEVIPHFTFFGDGWTDELSSMAEYFYLPIRSMIVDETNPMLEGINNDFHKAYPGHDSDLESDHVYNKYVSERLNNDSTVLKLVNEQFKMMPAAPFQFLYSEEDVDLRIYLRNTESCMVITFTIADPEVEAALRANGNIR